MSDVVGLPGTSDGVSNFLNPPLPANGNVGTYNGSGLTNLLGDASTAASVAGGLSSLFGVGDGSSAASELSGLTAPTNDILNAAGEVGVNNYGFTNPTSSGSTSGTASGSSSTSGGGFSAFTAWLSAQKYNVIAVVLGACFVLIAVYAEATNRGEIPIPIE